MCLERLFHNSLFNLIDLIKLIDNLEIKIIEPGNARISYRYKEFLLQDTRGGMKEYVMTVDLIKDFLSLLSFSGNLIDKLSFDTVASICNDLILGMEDEIIEVTVRGFDVVEIKIS